MRWVRAWAWPFTIRWRRSADDAVFRRARETAPFGFILKPFDEFALKANIEIALHNHRIERDREDLIQQLQTALMEIKTLRGLLPICAGCKKIRDDDNHWNRVEHYIEKHSEATFTHGCCPACLVKFMSDNGFEINEDLVRKLKNSPEDF